MREAWIDKEGKIHEGSHLKIAKQLFPKSQNPEKSCEVSNFVKLGMNWSGSPYMLVEHHDSITQAQRNSIAALWAEHYENKNITSRSTGITHKAEQCG